MLFVTIAVMYLCGYLVQYLFIFASIFIHEIAHSLVAFILERRVYGLKLMPVGLCVSIEELAFDRFENVLIYSSGPFANFLMFLILLLTGSDSNIYTTLKLANIYLAFFNIIPVLPLDGGKILLGLLAGRVGLFASYKYVRKISVFVGVFFVSLGVAQFISSSYNFSFLAIGFYLFFYIVTEKMEAALMNIKDIIFRRSRLVKKGIYPARDLVVIKWVQLGDILRSMDFDRFHLIHVLDDELKIIGVCTEQQIMDGIMKYDSSMTFDEFIKTLQC